jgi:hypothetical protein
MFSIKTTILNNIKLVESFKVKIHINFQKEAFIIQLNEVLICTLSK